MRVRNISLSDPKAVANMPIQIGVQAKQDGSGVHAEPTSKESRSNDTRPPGENNVSMEPMELRECSVSPSYSRKAESQSTESRDSSIDSDLLSISDDSDDLELLSHEDRIYLELISLVISIVAGDTGEATSGPSSSQTRAEPTANNSEYTRANSSLGGLGASGPSRKRGRAQKSTEDSDDEEPPQHPSRRASKSDGGDRRRYLACPFAKMYPEKHVPCFSLKLSRIRDVKQHLRRRHTPKFYCNRCKAIFPNDASLQEHVGNAAGLFCGPSAWLDGISPVQDQQLSKKSNPELTLEDQWFRMWDIIFTWQDRPSSAYIYFGFSPDLCSYREFSNSRMADLVVEGLRDSGFNAPGRTWDDVRRIVADRVDSSFDQWLSNRFANSMTLSDTSSSILHRTSTQATQQDTPASSESSRMGLRYQGAADESRNRPRPSAEVVLHQQAGFEQGRQANQGVAGNPFVSSQTINPALIPLQNTSLTDGFDWSGLLAEGSGPITFSVDTNSNLLPGESAAELQPTQPNPQ